MKLIILTKSKKYNEYCVAGVECDTGKKIRLISDDEEIAGALTDKDLQAYNGNVKCLDIVDVEIVEHIDNIYQKDNYHIVLKDLLSPIKDIFDYIIIDLPPSLGIITINALVASDSVLIPIQAEYFALEGLADLLNTINLVETRLRSPSPIKGILLTLYDSRTRLGREVYKELKNHFKDSEYIFKSVIPRNVRLAEAPSFGKPCLAYDSESTGARAYLSVAKEFLSLEDK